MPSEMMSALAPFADDRADDQLPPPSSSSSGPPDWNETHAKPLFQLKLKHLLLPYLVGLGWMLIHPLVSVVTGELKCRGIFVDESALEPHQLSIGPYPLEREWSLDYDGEVFRAGGRGGEEWGGLCDAVLLASAPSNRRGAGWESRRRRIGGDRGAVECVSPLHMGFDAVRIVPPSAPAAPIESIAVVVSAPPSSSLAGWTEGDFHVSVLNLIDRLSDPRKAAWLAKNVIVVSPRAGANRTLRGCLDDFLDAYLGARGGGGRKLQAPPSLPPRFTGSMLRQVLVLDAYPSSDSGGGEGGGGVGVSILPHGRNGVLPNLDLVFAAVSVYRYLRWLNNVNGDGSDGRLWMHPYPEHQLRAEAFLNKHIDSVQARRYGSDLTGMALFALGMIGPGVGGTVGRRSSSSSSHPPHAHALERGVDALTIRLSLPPKSLPLSSSSSSSPSQRQRGGMTESIVHSAAEFLQRTEQLLRAVSNTHERLHHSVTQYLLPSPFKFVSNGEYTYPAVLLAIPLVMRAVTVALVQVHPRVS